MTMLLVATTNPGKLREVRAILGSLPVRLVSLADYPDLPCAVEDHTTFEENARAKALHYVALAGCVTLADDSGLEVDALGGAPGVRSARYAGPNKNDAANNAKLIAELDEVGLHLSTAPVREWPARFRCAMALASSDGIIATEIGTLAGVIINEARGCGGFGYDPHFLVPELGKTTAQMSAEEKNRISHRGQALRKMKPHLEFLGLES